jgi:hypothetical protein
MEDEMVRHLSSSSLSAPSRRAIRNYKARVSSDRVSSANAYNTDSVLSRPASDFALSILQWLRPGTIRDVVYRIALPRPSVVERTYFSAYNEAAKNIYAAFGGEVWTQCRLYRTLVRST